MSKWWRLTVSAISMALAFQFTACHVADPADYQRKDLTLPTGDPPVSTWTREDGYVNR